MEALVTETSKWPVIKKTTQNPLFHRSFKQKLDNNHNNNNNNNNNKLTQIKFLRLTVLRIHQLKQSDS